MTKLLMCRPTYYTVFYEINPWMDRNKPPSQAIAIDQWNNLFNSFKQAGAAIELIEPVNGLPDLVFTANAATLKDNNVVVSKFTHPERQPESEIFASWFAANGYQLLQLDGLDSFEGNGDVINCGSRHFVGCGSRSSLASHLKVASALNLDIIPLQLIDDRFYHLDTAFAPINSETCIYVREAFSTDSNKVIQSHFSNIYQIPIEEATQFAANCVAIDDNVVISAGCPTTCNWLNMRGYRTLEVDLSMYKLSGGSARCLSLNL